MKKLVYGVGINDADYPVSCRVNGKKVMCKFYTTWVNMLRRCYCPKDKEKHPTYKDCLVATDWHSFTAFKRWMETQDWQGRHLDKDILIDGNKIYSSENCVFVDQPTNALLVSSKSRRSDLPLGVVWCKRSKKYKPQCNNGSGKRESLGYFDTVEEAEGAYNKFKAAVIAKTAVRQTDFRVYEALMVRAVELNLA